MSLQQPGFKQKLTSFMLHCGTGLAMVVLCPCGTIGAICAATTGGCEEDGLCYNFLFPGPGD